MPANLRVLVGAQTLRGIGLLDVVGGGSVTPIYEYWQPRAGEDYLDGYQPTKYGTPVFAGDVTNSRDLKTIRTEAGKITNNGQFVIQYDDGDYYFNNVTNYGTASVPNWISWANGPKRVMGERGSGFNPTTGALKTRFIMAADCMANSPGALEYAFDPAVVNGTPLGMTVGGYFSGDGQTVPFFWSGIDWLGQQQESRTFGALAKSKFSRNVNAAAPAPYGGLTWWRAPAGSIMQYSRFQGFSQTYNSAPPYENAPFNSNYAAGALTFAVEIDGRTAQEFDPQRRRVSGGLMKNKEFGWTERRVKIHHLRRSGSAVNTNTHEETDLYTFDGVDYTDISNVGEDGWPSDIGNSLPGGFNGLNLEGMVGKVVVRNSRINSEHSTMNLVVPAAGGDGRAYDDPNQLLIDFADLVTDDPVFNQCVRINVSTDGGKSPVWKRLNTDFTSAAALYFKGYRAGVKLNPVRASQFNSALHTPFNSFVVKGL